MARNKYPEETIDKIMKVTAELFMEKGYDQTSMQDIVNRLGMSKGAIYHHFKSKEDLLNKISSHYFSDIDWFLEIVNDRNKNGLEKLRAIFFHELENDEKITMDRMTRPLLQDPKMFMEQFKCSMQEVAPLLTKIIEEGVADGSLHAEYPEETAELLLLAINIWLNPGTLPCGREQFLRKTRYLKFLMDASGVPIFNDEVIKIAEHYFDIGVGGVQ